MPDKLSQSSYKEEVVQNALDRWKGSSSKRGKIRTALNKKQYDKVESNERMAKRVNRALNVVESRLGEQVSEFMSPDVQEVMAAGGISEGEVTNILFERVIGQTRDLLQIDFFSRGLKVSRCVGRVLTPVGASRVSYGTGFLIAPGLMMTNWHVIETIEDAAKSTFQLDYQADFDPQTFKLDTRKFFHSNKDLDFAIVAVDPISDGGVSLSKYGWCPLVGAEGKVSIGEPVNIIQHPLGQMKQVAFRENKLLDLDQKSKNFAYYEVDTEQGSSGSPVFSDQWEVIALHHSGVPKTNTKGEWIKMDGSVFKKGDNPGSIHWIGNEGIRVSALINYLKSLSLDGNEGELVQQVILATEPPAEPDIISDDLDMKEPMETVSVSPTPESVSIRPVVSSQNIFNFFGATNVYVSPTGVQASGATTEYGEVSSGSSRLTDDGNTKDRTIGLEKVQPDPDYISRPGYDSEFLSFSVPLPQPVGDWRDLAIPVPDADESSPFELKYYHYSVIMNKERKLAAIAAVNFNPLAAFQHRRERDKWYYDPRIGKEFQLGEKLYAGNPLDRGHLVRRNDSGWGDSKEEAKSCNDDTFHFTNCSPQHEVFNQSGLATNAGVLLWGNLENHISKQGKKNARRISIFNGPIFRKNDRVYRKIAQLPKEFWKVVVYADDDGTPRAAAFKLSQAVLIASVGLNEKVDFADYEVYQVSIDELATDTGLNFGNLVRYDTKSAFETLEESKSAPKPLGGLGDIQL